MKCLLDTHFLIWIVSDARRLRKFPWLQRYSPWGVSPISLVEIQVLAESGKREVNNPGFMQAVRADPRFTLDDVSLVALAERSLSLAWTRDPFDRLIAAHSLARRVPVCTVDSTMLENHSLIVPELRG